MSFLVVGMHRSGTSTVGRVLDRLGVSTGAPNRLIGPTESNQTGHWEVLSLALFNNSVLEALGGSWLAPPPPDAERLTEMAGGPLGEDARKLLDTELPDGPWFWKDPRLSLLLPFWRRLLADPPVVYVFRHPAEVARSLETRDGMHVAYGRVLWERYVRQAICESAGLDSFVLDYDSLVEAPESTIEPLAGFLNRRGFAIGASEIAAAATAVAAEERHHRGDDGQPLAQSQRVLLELLTAHRGAALPSPSDVPPETVGLDLAFAARAEETRRWRVEVAGVQTDLEAAQKLAVQAREQAELARQQLVERHRRSLEQLRRTNGELRRANDEVRRANAALTRAVDEAQGHEQEAHAALDAVYATKTFRLLAPLRRAYARARSGLRR